MTADRARNGVTPAEQHRDQAELVRGKVLSWRDKLARVDNATFIDRLVDQTLQGLEEDLAAVAKGRCPEDPRRLKGAPIGQHHCPRCGCMTLAGVGHVHDEHCWLGLGSLGG